MSYDMDLGGSGYSSSIDAGVFGGLMGFFGGMIIVISLISLVLGIFYVIVYWKLFKKANQPGWAAIVPIYNIIIMLKVAKMPLWWIAIIVAGCIPIAGPIALIVFNIFFSLNIAKSFGKDTTFGVLTIFFSAITLPILAFGDAKYIDGDANSANSTQPTNNQQQPNDNIIQSQPVQSTEQSFQNTEQSFQSQNINSVVPEQTVDNNINQISSEEKIAPTWTMPEQDTTENQNNNNTNL